MRCWRDPLSATKKWPSHCKSHAVNGLFHCMTASRRNALQKRPDALQALLYYRETQSDETGESAGFASRAGFASLVEYSAHILLLGLTPLHGSAGYRMTIGARGGGIRNIGGSFCKELTAPLSTSLIAFVFRLLPQVFEDAPLEPSFAFRPKAWEP